MLVNQLKKVLILLLIVTASTANAQRNPKNRVIILTDIEADADDTQSMIRLLLYSNDIDIKGLIATTSVHQKTRIAPESIQKIISVYNKVLPNLRKHDAAYPNAQKLAALVKNGQTVYGLAGTGAGKQSPGSEWIIKELEKTDSRPLWISVWGGVNTLAQALFTIKTTKDAAVASKLISKLRVYTISDQDDSGIWIRNTFPDLFYIVTPGAYSKATWLAISKVVPGINNETVSNRWLADNIQQGKGPLGAIYPDVAYGMEGDTPSWLSLIPNGLNVPGHPDWGGWGGRYELYKPNLTDFDTKGFTGGVPVEPETRTVWANTADTYTPVLFNNYGRSVRNDTLSFHDNWVTIWRWRDDFQNDFAARMDWTTKPYHGANHPPLPALAHAAALTVTSGENFWLDADGTTDPDGDNLSYLWFQYTETGTLKTPVKFLIAENLYRVLLTAPDVKTPQTTQFILKVTDKGKPALSRYKRVMLTIKPR